MSVTYTVGDTREVIKTIPDGSVDLIATSPPFLALRSYVPADHESKGDEIGSERNPAEFIDMLLGLTAEWGRVLAPHGSIAIELGDTYSGSGGAGGDYTAGGLREGQPGFTGSALRSRKAQPFENALYTENDLPPRNGRRNRPADVASGILAPTSRPGPEGRDKIPGWPLAKSLALIPQLYAIALAYGINPLTGQASPAGRWRVRNVIVWHRPNPAVGALGDKVRPSTSYIVVATRSPKRWFDLTAVRNEFVPHGSGGGSGRVDVRDPRPGREGQEYNRDQRLPERKMTHAGAPPLDAWFDEYDGSHDTWTLTTQPSRIKADIVERVPCGPDDGGERTTSPDCPVHGDLADLTPTERHGELATSPSSRISRTDDHRDLGPQQSDACDAETSSCSHRTRSSATPCDKESSRTDLDQSTSAPGTPSARTTVDTAHTPESPESFGDRRGTSASSNGEVCPPADVPETAPRNGHKSDLESACTCTFHLDKYSIHSHYAMWPAKLAERLILSMCPREVCRICGEPRRRIEGAAEYTPSATYRGGSLKADATRLAEGVNQWIGNNGATASVNRSAPTLGWTDCGCDIPATSSTGVWNCSPDELVHYDWSDIVPRSNYRPGLVLDPFAGSGTTLAVADLHGRDAIGIDFDARNKAIYPARYDEVKKALYGTPTPMPGQGDLFAEVAG